MLGSEVKIIRMSLVPKGGCDEGQRVPGLAEGLQTPWTFQPFSSELGMWST